MILRPAVFDHDVATIDETCFAQALSKSRNQMDARLERAIMKESNHRHRRLLRPRRERPRGCRAAEQRDELAAVHVWMAPAWQEKM